MLLLPEVNQRRRVPEIMDEPGLDVRRHFAALRGLARINAWSGSIRILWQPIRDLAQKKGEALRVLDIATGAGDIPVRLWQRAQRAGICLTMAACDCSPHALEYARQRATQAKAPVRFFEWDAFENSLPADYDVVMSSLFLHHLDENQAVQLLRRMAQAATHLVLVNDLVRSPAGFLLAYFGTRLLTTSGVVHTDGPRSVEAAFTVEEIRLLAERAGLAGTRVDRRWPCRMLLTWERR
jgi:2-polyprenyl-3-methyl-5-hydroxy-6-metoxy-1,4-benzoquinol methylase